jgi:hypothetical protein
MPPATDNEGDLMALILYLLAVAHQFLALQRFKRVAKQKNGNFIARNWLLTYYLVVRNRNII